MSDSRPEKLIRAEKLLYDGKVEEALEMVINFEKRSDLTPKDQLSSLLLKGLVYASSFQHKKAVEVGEDAYLMSQELGLVLESIEALILKANLLLVGNPDEAFSLILEAEKLLNSFSDESSTYFIKLKTHLSFWKSLVYFYKSDIDKALDLALESLALGIKIKNKVIIGSSLGTISMAYWHKGEHDIALEHATKCLRLYEELNLQFGIAYGLWLMGHIYSLKGELNRALGFCKKALSIEEIIDITKVNVLYVLGRTYRLKGELDKALKYAKQTANLAEEMSHGIIMTVNTRGIGEIYMRKGESDEASKYFEQSLVLSEKSGYTMTIIPALLDLLLINLDNKSHEKAQKYLKRLEMLSDQYESTLVKHGYPLGKALVLKASSRMADHTDAARILKQIIDDDIIWPQFHILSIVSLCELLLEELSMYNNPEIIDEIYPLLINLLNIAEIQHSFTWMAEGKLLQAKLALIQMKVEGAKKLLTDAQSIAELNGLQLLARKISSEHDSLLKQSKVWKSLKEKNASMSERIDLASVNGVFDRLKGKSAVDPPEIVEEQPTLLLIIAEGGSLLFSHKFVEEFSYEEDVISGFLTAFNTFSGELFSKGLDRAKFGEDTILMEPVNKFSVCYLFKGQTYPAIQKLNRFAEQINKSTDTLETLDKLYNTSQVLDLKNNPLLESLIDEIFIKKSLELNV